MRLSMLSWRERRVGVVLVCQLLVEMGVSPCCHLASGCVRMLVCRIPWVGGGAACTSSGARWLIPCILYLLDIGILCTP